LNTPKLEPIDPEQERREAQPAMRARMALIVDLAKSEAWRLIGEREQGHALLEPHVWPVDRQTANAATPLTSAARS
jgi:hypothetical protein